MGGGQHTRHDGEICDKLCNAMSVALLVIAYPSGEILYVNQKVCVDLGVSRHNLVGSSYQSIFLPEFHEVYEKLADQCQDGGDHTATYYWTEKLLWEQISAKMILWNSTMAPDGDDAPASGTLRSILLSITNITEVAQKQHEYEQAAYFDSLTGLPNAKKLDVDLAEIGLGSDVYFIYLQMENFDDIVDIYGWDAADQIRLQTRDWLIQSETHRVQFYKGERGFILLARGVTKEATIERIELILERFNHPWKVLVDDTVLSVYCKIRIGGVVGDYVRSEIRTILLRTIQMGRQSHLGYTIYDQEEEKLLKSLHALRTELIDSVFNEMKGFSVAYQPIVEAQSGRWAGIECLCRWQSPAGRMVPPDEFIPALEQVGFIARVDNWVRREALQQCAALGLNKGQVYLDINFSPVQSIDQVYILELFNDLAEADFPVDHLIIEITEGAEMQFSDENLKGLELLRQSGVKISLDDFGTGYASLENLLRLEATTLKVDKLLVDALEDKEDKQYLVGVLIDLAHHLNMLNIIEGVETEQQRKLLLDYGADYIQGFLFSKPLSARELAREAWRFEKQQPLENQPN